MIRSKNGLRFGFFATSAFLVGLLSNAVHAEAKAHHVSHKAGAHSTDRIVSSRHARRLRVAHRTSSHYAKVHRVVWQGQGGGTWLQCVPYARRVSGIDLTGNAYTWWREADGRYERGQVPQPGAVLSFQRTRGMELGHVAVVTEAVNSREILITQANWPMPGLRHSDISHAISVIDVSPDNDWTAVRVQIGHSDRYGAVYRTNGFIYGRNPGGTMMAEADRAAAAASGATGSMTGWSQTVQLALAPSYGENAIADTAPDRELQ